MSIFQRMLVATDFSDRAGLAEARAAQLSREHQSSSAELLTVRERGEPAVLAQVMNSTEASATAMITSQAKRELELRAGLLKDNFGIDFSCHVRFGQTAPEILAHADEMDADLLVIGAHGGNFFSDLLLGNTADKLTHLCRRPLLVVKTLPQRDYQNVLVPVDFSDDSRRAAELALAIAPQAHVTFLHAFDVLFEGRMQYANVARHIINDYRLKAQEDAREQMNQFIAGLDASDRIINRTITFGFPGPVVRDHAKSAQPDLIVLGKHGKSRFAELILGSVTRDTIDQTDCDVLVVPVPRKD
ncbi:universal stress protein [Noviherbaspirillum sp. ST9]|uniref:universal stress protein n=1 Tax=Noviherbaspirillum sp. ST9 TaxID=3401606 RepID=UPI003B587BBC